MRIEQAIWNRELGWRREPPGALTDSFQLVLIFGATSVLKDQKVFQEIRGQYPSAHMLGCSTAGEIAGTQVFDDSLVTTAIAFESTRIEGARIALSEAETAFHAGERLAMSLSKEGLVHVFVLSDGLKVNGSDLVKGLTKNLPAKVTVTGGLAGDGDRFRETLVFWDGSPEKRYNRCFGLVRK